MKKIVVLLFFAVCFLSNLAFGQRVEFTKPYEYTASGGGDRNSVKAKAMEDAHAALLQVLDVLVEARQKIKAIMSGNSSNQDFGENLKTYTGTIGKVQTIVVAGTEKFSDNENGDMVYFVTFKMAVDTADLYKYLDNIVWQKERAIADSLENVKRDAEMEAEAARRRRAQIEQAKKDSIAKAEKIRNLELAVKTAKDLFSLEEARINLLRIEKEKKENELNEADAQRKNAQKAFDDAKNADDAHTETGIERTNVEAGLLHKAKENHDKKLSEYNAADRDFSEADKKAESAKKTLQTAEENLVKEIESFELASAKIISGIECVLVKAGTIIIGSPTSESGREVDEIRHIITLTKDYYIGKYEVTQAQYEAVTGRNPSYFKGDNLPVENVSWDEAAAFCKKVGGRLPTEAEWGLAARGGNNSKGYKYSGSDNVSVVAWYNVNSGDKILKEDVFKEYLAKNDINGYLNKVLIPNKSRTRPVGQKSPNELGIHDMSGNVWEWCSDWYGGYPIGSGVLDPEGPGSGVDRVVRGGSWNDYAWGCRVAHRDCHPPSSRYDILGFRVVFDVK